MCGSYPDSKIFQTDISEKLNTHETIIADNRYSGNQCIKLATIPQNYK